MLKDAEQAEIRNNYLRLSRLVHPDKCKHPQAADASAVLNQAKETLSNPLKKKLYDAYVTDVNEGPPGAAEMSYAEWEAANAMNPVKVPVSGKCRHRRLLAAGRIITPFAGGLAIYFEILTIAFT